MGAHSILPPSGAKAWRRCALWVSMNAAYPSDDTPESMEGTAAHWVAGEQYEGRDPHVGITAPNGIIVTEEMVEGGELLNEVIESLAPANQFDIREIEKPVAIRRIHEHCWGTPDFWAYSRQAHLLRVIDYKFGNRFVDEFENDQCVAYVAGIVDKLASLYNIGPGLFDQALTVEITIVQPRCYYRGAPVRTWRTRAVDLRGQINILSMAAEASLKQERTATTNDECCHCPGRASCPALQLAGYSDAEFAVANATPHELSPAAASLELRMLERALGRLQSRVEGLREVVLSFARRGDVTPFHRVEHPEGRAYWTLSPDQIVAVGQLYGKDLSKKAVVTPNQAVKLGIDEAVIKAYSSKSSGNARLVQANPADAARVFGKN